MEKLKKVSRAQWCLFALFIGFAFLMQNCQDDDAVIYEENQTETELNARPVSGKVDVCRYNARKDTYSIVTVVAKRVLITDVVLDFDGDGYVNANECKVAGLGIDCDDTNAAITRITYYQDSDGDGYGNPFEYVDCTKPFGYVDNNLDCDDTNAAITRNTYYKDFDGDGFGDISTSGQSCEPESGYVLDNTDCDDYDIAINPGVIEICDDGLDNNCNGEVDEGCSIGSRTFVPDNNFEQALIDLSLDDVLDDYVLTANINTLHYLDVFQRGISDLTGIEDFAALQELSCWENNLTSLNLSQNTELTDVICSTNYLTSINVSNCINLNNLDCSDNQLPNLNLSANTALTYLSCGGNQISDLSLVNNEVLLNLYCYNNGLESLNIINCTALVELNCSNNLLGNLNVMANTNLTYLDCAYNQLTNIEMYEYTPFVGLYCNDNLLTNLDVSRFEYLTNLDCSNNSISTCIKVSQYQYDNYISGWLKDDDATFSLLCPS